MKYILFSFLMLLSLPTFAAPKPKVAKVEVYKYQRVMELVGTNGKVIKRYQISLGLSPVGHKYKEGDNRTPVGSYILDYKNENSKFYKSIHVSYPNATDIARAKKNKVNPGGDIMIHGLPNNTRAYTAFLESVGLAGLADDVIRAALPFLDWTQGCIAVTNENMEEIYDLVDTPTPINIYHF